MTCVVPLPYTNCWQLLAVDAPLSVPDVVVTKNEPPVATLKVGLPPLTVTVCVESGPL